MPVPDATPAPTPAFGLFGKPLQDAGNGEYKESEPDGSYLFWRLEDLNGKKVWMPYKSIPPDKTIVT